MLTIQQAVQRQVETVLLVTFGGIQDTGLQTRDRIEQGHSGNLTAGQHEITQTDLIRHTRIDKPLIDAFIATTNEYGARAMRPMHYRGVVKRSADWRKENDGRNIATLRLDRIKALTQGLCHHDHAGTTTERTIIHAPVIALGQITGICQPNINLTRLVSASRDAAGQQRSE